MVVFRADHHHCLQVLSLDAEKNRVVLTLKRSLVNSDLPVPTSIEDVKVGQVVHAMVQNFLNKDMLVELFAGLRAFVPVAEAADHFVENIQKEFTLGQVVKVRIIHVDKENRRITASVKQALDSYEPMEKKVKNKGYTFSEDVSAVEIGTKTAGEIAAIHESQIILSLKNTNVKALLSISAVAKHRKQSPMDIKAALAVGQILEDLAIVSKNDEKAIVIVGLTQPKAGPSLVIERGGISIGTEQALITFDSLAEGHILEGLVGDSTGTGHFVQLGRGIRGKLAATELSDDYDAVKAMNLSKGAKVKCIIYDYDKDDKRIDLSLRRSRLEGVDSSEIRDPIVDDLKTLTKDKTLRGFVRSVSDSGLFIEIGKGLTARVQIKVRRTTAENDVSV